MTRMAVWTGSVLIVAWTTFATGQTTPTESAPPQLKSPPADGDVVVKVNDDEIKQREIDEMFQAIIQEQAQGRQIPPQQLPQIRERMEPQIIDALIDNHLLDEQVAQSEIKVTDAELMAEMEKILRGHLVRSGTTREEFAKRIETQTGKPLSEFLTARATDKEFKRAMLQGKLLEKQFPEEVKVTDEAVKARYEEDLEEIYQKPAMVRASHILIGTQDAATPEAKSAARKKAEEVLAEVRQPGASFAKVAEAESTCPSKAQGGDLGYFPREGAMVEPFAATAFALDAGQISDVVETQFGYHVIKVTDKQEPVTITLTEATETIREELRDQKIADVRQRHVAKLRADAKIVYTNGRDSTG